VRCRIRPLQIRVCRLLTLVLATASTTATIASAYPAPRGASGAWYGAQVQLPRPSADGRQGAHDFPAATAAALTSIVQQGMTDSHSPGLVVGIWVPGQGTYVRSFGTSDTATGAPMSRRDHFRIASITKTFVSTAILRLKDQGQLSLDAPLSQFVAGVPNGDRISIAQLLDMTAGVYDFTGDDAFLKAYTEDPELPFATSDFLAIIHRHDPLFAPGARAQYDDSNYFLLGLVAEAVTQQPLARVIQDEVLDPLGMSETSYPTTPAMPSPFTRGYVSESDGSLRDVTTSNPAVAGGAGAMISTLHDQKIWARALATGALLEPSTQELRLQTRVLQSGPVTVSYGMGIANINGFIGHNGGIFGYSTATFYLPSHDATLVVLGNNNDLFSAPTLDMLLKLGFALFPEQFPNGL
jgi:D-alanyl-D-alanine carboxypeptidase